MKDNVLKEEFEKLKQECERYEKALNEIKGHAQSMLDDFEEDSIDQKFEYCKQIGMLIETIINKAKGG